MPLFRLLDSDQIDQGRHAGATGTFRDGAVVLADVDRREIRERRLEQRPASARSPRRRRPACPRKEGIGLGAEQIAGGTEAGFPSQEVRHMRRP